LLIPVPIGTAPYADYATAETAIADQVFDCVAFSAFDFVSIAVTPGVNAIQLVGTHSAAGQNSTDMWVAMALKAGSLLTFDWDTSSTGTDTEADSSIAIAIYQCDGTQIGSYGDSNASPSGFSGTWTGPEGGLPPALIPIPADGVYYIYVNFASGYGTTTATSSADWTITSDDTAVVLPVIALWDDSGTTRQLEACPKMIIPLQFGPYGSLGAWYADETEATAAITDLTSNCVGFGFDAFAPGTPTDFTATDGVTSLTLAATLAADALAEMYGSFQVTPGDTVSVNVSVTNATHLVQIYDEVGTMLEQFEGTGSHAFTAQSASGLYYVRCGGGTNESGGSASFAFTSSGDLSVNPIQALYDVGLTCPARLDCS
jgi:hypothetical protein